MDINVARLKREKRQVHLALHDALDGKDPGHKPGYGDVATTLLAVRLQDIFELVDDLVDRNDRLTSAVERLLARRKKRPLTAWQQHVRDTLRGGGTIKAAASTWGKKA